MTPTQETALELLRARGALRISNRTEPEWGTIATQTARNLMRLGLATIDRASMTARPSFGRETATCGECGRTFRDGTTPAGRCPFEYSHADDYEWAQKMIPPAQLVSISYSVPVMATVDLDSKTVTRIRIIGEAITQDRAGYAENAETFGGVSDADLARAYDVAESADWPGWEAN